MKDKQISIGLFIDGGYYAQIDRALYKQSGLNINIQKLFNYIRTQISEAYQADFRDCQITESHYFRGRYRAFDASNKRLLYDERNFEDDLIENDIIFHYKHLREIKKDGTTMVIEKGIDVWFALETYELSQIRQFDFVILITGDADHEMLIRKLKTMKVRVLLLTWNITEQSSTSPFLKEEAIWHIDLGEECAKDRNLINTLCKKS